jgi:hypothetical protein
MVDINFADPSEVRVVWERGNIDFAIELVRSLILLNGFAALLSINILKPDSSRAVGTSAEKLQTPSRSLLLFAVGAFLAVLSGAFFWLGIAINTLYTNPYVKMNILGFVIEHSDLSFLWIIMLAGAKTAIVSGAFFCFWCNGDGKVLEGRLAFLIFIFRNTDE